MAIINTIRESGNVQLTPLIPLLLTKWHDPGYSHNEQYWDMRSITDLKVPVSEDSWCNPELIITDKNTKDAYLYTAWGSDGYHCHNVFIPLVDFSIEIYSSTNYGSAATLSSIQLVDIFTFKSGHPYDLVLPTPYLGHASSSSSALIRYYNGSSWNNTLWYYNEENSWLVKSASDGNTTIDLSFKAHILSPLIFKQPNYNL